MATASISLPSPSSVDVAYEIRLIDHTHFMVENFVSTDLTLIDAKRQQWRDDSWNRNHCIMSYEWANGTRRQYCDTEYLI